MSDSIIKPAESTSAPAIIRRRNLQVLPAAASRNTPIRRPGIRRRAVGPQPLDSVPPVIGVAALRATTDTKGVKPEEKAKAALLAAALYELAGGRNPVAATAVQIGKMTGLDNTRAVARLLGALVAYRVVRSNSGFPLADVHLLDLGDKPVAPDPDSLVAGEGFSLLAGLREISLLSGPSDAKAVPRLMLVLAHLVHSCSSRGVCVFSSRACANATGLDRQRMVPTLLNHLMEMKAVRRSESHLEITSTWLSLMMPGGYILSEDHQTLGQHRPLPDGRTSTSTDPKSEYDQLHPTGRKSGKDTPSERTSAGPKIKSRKGINSAASAADSVADAPSSEAFPDPRGPVGPAGSGKGSNHPAADVGDADGTGSPSVPLDPYLPASWQLKGTERPPVHLPPANELEAPIPLPEGLENSSATIRREATALCSSNNSSKKTFVDWDEIDTSSLTGLSPHLVWLSIANKQRCLYMSNRRLAHSADQIGWCSAAVDFFEGQAGGIFLPTADSDVYHPLSDEPTKGLPGGEIKYNPDSGELFGTQEDRFQLFQQVISIARANYHTVCPVGGILMNQADLLRYEPIREFVLADQAYFQGAKYATGNNGPVWCYRRIRSFLVTRYAEDPDKRSLQSDVIRALTAHVSDTPFQDAVRCKIASGRQTRREANVDLKIQKVIDQFVANFDLVDRLRYAGHSPSHFTPLFYLKWLKKNKGLREYPELLEAFTDIGNANAYLDRLLGLAGVKKANQEEAQSGQPYPHLAEYACPGFEVIRALEMLGYTEFASAIKSVHEPVRQLMWLESRLPDSSKLKKAIAEYNAPWLGRSLGHRLDVHRDGFHEIQRLVATDALLPDDQLRIWNEYFKPSINVVLAMK